MLPSANTDSVFECLAITSFFFFCAAFATLVPCYNRSQASLLSAAVPMSMLTLDIVNLMPNSPLFLKKD